MTLHRIKNTLNYTVLYPSHFTMDQLQKAFTIQIEETQSKLLFTHNYPQEFYQEVLKISSHRPFHLYLKSTFDNDLTIPKIRHQIQDQLCFQSDSWMPYNPQTLYIEFSITAHLKSPTDFLRYLADIYFFWSERFAQNFTNIFLRFHLEEVNIAQIRSFFQELKSIVKAPKLAFSPYDGTKNGLDLLKDFFLLRPIIGSLILQDRSFDDRIDVPPGQGIVLNQSVVEMMLEQQNELLCLFAPNHDLLPHPKQNKLYLKECERFAAKIS